MKIILMRHGPVQYDLNKKRRAKELTRAVLEYKHASLCDNAIAPFASLQAAKQCEFILCSELLRAKQSLSVMGLRADVTDAVFNESDLPHLRFPSPALSIRTWAVIFRLLSLLGLQRHGEGVAMMTSRIRRGVDQLEDCAANYRSVLLMGHGLTNHFVGKELIHRGWRRKEYHGHAHWAYSVYQVDRHD